MTSLCRSGRRRWLCAALLAVLGSGCGTMATPVLRHETGESLGTGHFRAAAYLQSNRLYPFIGALEPAAGAPQSASVFQGGGFGVMGSAGVLPALDLQLGTAFSAGGGGWRVGAKYQWLRLGPWAAAGMFGYGAYSGEGDVTFLTARTPETLTLAMSGKMWEFSLPVSFRLSPAFAVYSGLAFYHATVRGSAGQYFVNDDANEFGTNLGVRITAGRIEGDLEAAFLRLRDPFQDTMRFVPYVGIGVGLTF